MPPSHRKYLMSYVKIDTVNEICVYDCLLYFLTVMNKNNAQLSIYLRSLKLMLKQFEHLKFIMKHMIVSLSIDFYLIFRQI